ncbi:MAG: hypothetical protein ACJAZ2_002001 [Glaciecola sp.]|jgi:hypothetical protein
MELIKNWKFAVLISLTLGLAPFTPEPHIWGKVKWIAGGGNGMGLMDWWDAVIHGTPFVLLARVGVVKLRAYF